MLDSRSLPEPSLIADSGNTPSADYGEESRSGVLCLVTAHNGPQVTIHYKRAEVLGCLRAVLHRKLSEGWSPPEPEETYGVRMAVGGASVELQLGKEHTRRGGGIRGEITGFSRQSRSRLMHDLASINRDVVDPRQMLFITLTYHNNWSEDPADQYRQLRAWFKRMNRRWPGIVMKWRKEWQERLAPHFHVIVYTPAGAIPSEGEYWCFAEDASEEWVGVARRPGDSKHHMYRHAVKVRYMESWDRVIAYASKTAEYLSKTETVQPVGEDGQPLPTGRLWGTLGNRKNVPVEYDFEGLERDQFMRARRVFRRLARPKDRRRKLPRIGKDHIANRKVLLSYSTASRYFRWLGESGGPPPDAAAPAWSLRHRSGDPPAPRRTLDPTARPDPSQVRGGVR